MTGTTWLRRMRNQRYQPVEDIGAERYLNTAEELGNGIVKTRLNNSKEYTIVLVGETGTGKTTFLSLLSNVLLGRTPDNYEVRHDKGNEAGGGDRHSQTNAAKLYEFQSRNGVAVRILDTPGLADTRGLAQDTIHKASIAQTVKEHITTIDAVLVLANGTLPRLGIATDYALSILSSIFPRSFEANIGLLLTNVSNSLSLNIDPESLPEILRQSNSQFLIDNPVAHWRKSMTLISQKSMKRAARAELKNSLHDAHRVALTSLVALFNWLDTLTPRQTNDVYLLHEKSLEMERCIHLQNSIVIKKIWVQTPTATWNTMCLVPGCHSNCFVGPPGTSVRPASEAADQFISWAISTSFHVVTSFLESSCSNCNHPDNDHSCTRAMWQQHDESEDFLNQIELLAREYAELSLSGTFVGPVRKTVALLELQLESARNNGDVEFVRMAQEDLTNMKRKLEILVKAKANTAEELGEGIVKTRSNGSGEYTILLGETGTGKTTFLSLLANVLAGCGPGTYEEYQDQGNEAGGSQMQSQTNYAKLYEFRSLNGITVRILDTPGLVDTRGLAQDNEPKASIANAIKDHVPAVNAIIVVANGTLPRLGVATDYALATLSSLFPRSLEANIGFLFTNISNPLSRNFDLDALPQGLRGRVNQFFLDNPIALWKKCMEMRFKKRKKAAIAEMEESIRDAHRKALKNLALMFDWLDTLEPQLTKEILVLFEKSQEIERNITNFLSLALQWDDRQGKLKDIIKDVKNGKTVMEQYRDYQNILADKVWTQVETAALNKICVQPHCYSNCEEGDPDSSWFDRGIAHAVCAVTSVVSFVLGIECSHCKHFDHRHSLTRARWEKKEQRIIVTNEDMKKNFIDAKTEYDQQAQLAASIQNTIADLDKEIGSCLIEVNRLTEEYAQLSLSGGFVGPVRKSIALLELNLESVQNNGDVEVIRKIQENLESVKKKVEILEKAKHGATVPKSRANVKRMVGGVVTKAKGKQRSFQDIFI